MAARTVCGEEGAEDELLGAEAAALALDASEEAAAEAAEEELSAAKEDDLAELVWKETCSSAERNEGWDEVEEACMREAAAEEEDAAAEAAAATTRRGHADDAPAVTPSSSSSIVIVGGTSGLMKEAPPERRGIAMPSPRKPSAEGEKALEAEREASLAREVKGRGGVKGVGAAGVVIAVAFEDEGASAERAGRRMEAGRMKGMVGRGV